MKLNCDLGESYGTWHLTDDEKIMPYIDMANIACGYHAGDPVVIQRAIAAANANNVLVGAHPSYPDLQGFGRRSMKMAESELVALLHYQISALEGMAKCQDVELGYVKPHGALYNDMMAIESVFGAVLQAVSGFHKAIPLVVQATPNWQQHQQQAKQLDVTLWFEAFADRRYQDNGALLPRSESGAVLDAQGMRLQVEQLVNLGEVTTSSGNTLKVNADTLCVHGDNDEALQGIQSIRQFIAS